jgi:hypothetical protein
MVEVLQVFYYFSGFPDDAGMVTVNVGWDFCFVKVDTVL